MTLASKSVSTAFEQGCKGQTQVNPHVGGSDLHWAWQLANDVGMSLHHSAYAHGWWDAITDNVGFCPDEFSDAEEAYLAGYNHGINSK